MESVYTDGVMRITATVGLEFQIPSYVSRYASFYFSFLGRGICKSLRDHGASSATILTILRSTVYAFVGTLIFQLKWINYVPGAIVVAVGIGYAALEFVPSIEPPANMREADQGWGAEQV